ncbi:MAG TPA: glucokinase [Gemmatimonadaceae bacterium]|nr:glucokinase [Gemmatimonadaceae bacterium]
MRVLAGDIGGTSARLALVDIDAHTARLLATRCYASDEFPGLAPIVKAFLAEVGETPSQACFGVACPLSEGKCIATNLAWIIDVGVLREEIGIVRTGVINDLHAVGRGLDRLDAADLLTLQAGEPKERGTIALIGAGTGLGEAFLTWGNGAYEVHASEGGHASFSSGSELEWRLHSTLARRFGHVSFERVVSGPGLANIYDHLIGVGDIKEQASVRAEMRGADPAPVIARHGLAGTDALCELALDMFTWAYGSQAGNLALTIMATGGVYVAGGIAPRIVPKLLDGTFMTAFRSKGRLSNVMEKIPVNVIVNPHVGIIGAAAVAMEQ